MFSIIVALLALLLGSRLSAAEAISRHEDVAAEQQAFSCLYAYDITGDEEACEAALYEEYSKKVGAPVPGMMLSMLIAGGLARLLIRMKRRAKQSMEAIVVRLLSLMKFAECRNALYMNLNRGYGCCLRWQHVVLRL